MMYNNDSSNSNDSNNQYSDFYLRTLIIDIKMENLLKWEVIRIQPRECLWVIRNKYTNL